MTAKRYGDGYILDGEKTWISNGGIADFYVVFARTGEAPGGQRGLSAFPGAGRRVPGFPIAERIDVIMRRIRWPRFDIQDRVRVPASAP